LSQLFSQAHPFCHLFGTHLSVILPKNEVGAGPFGAIVGMLLPKTKDARMEPQPNLGFILSSQEIAPGELRVALEIDILHAKSFGDAMEKGIFGVQPKTGQMKILVIGVEDGLAISARTFATAAGVLVIKNGNLSAIDQPLGHRIIETPPMASFKQSKACLQQARSNLFRQLGRKAHS
jgi:hypothetical protein